MASFQNDYPQTEKDLVSLVDLWAASTERAKQRAGWDYYQQNNSTVRELKKYFFSDKLKRQVENPYVANYKIGYGFFHDMVSQKVNTLLDETPTIEAKGTPIEDKFVKEVGYALKNAGLKASAQSTAFIYQSITGSLTVFNTENCIPFWDDTTGDLRALVRYWDVNYLKGEYTRYIELYAPDGLTVYRTAHSGGLEIVQPFTGYKIRTLRDFRGESSTVEQVMFPIVELRNNEERESDLKPSIRAKIDAIDIVNSGFMNNIEDFSEAFWVIKNNAGFNSDQFEDFIASIKQTRKFILPGDGMTNNDVEAKTFDIPTEARTKFVEDRKKELIEESGVLDTASITGSSVTNVAIKAAQMKLRQRVSDFEWEVYRTATKLIEVYQSYRGLSFDFDIEFTPLLIQNDTEIIQNANTMRPDISKEWYLTLLQRAGYLDDVKEELKRQSKEDLEKYSLKDEEEIPVVPVTPPVEE